jgi:hypothetical protein
VDWLDLFWWGAVVTAVAGGVLSTGAFVLERRTGGREPHSHVLYLASYVCMSLSIFCVAFRGLID